MEIDKLDRAKVIHLMHVIALVGPCENSNCSHCQIMAKIVNIPQVRTLVEQTVLETNRTGNLNSLEYIFFLGFIVAWEYRDAMELEELLKRS